MNALLANFTRDQIVVHARTDPSIDGKWDSGQQQDRVDAFHNKPRSGAQT